MTTRVKDVAALTSRFASRGEARTADAGGLHLNGERCVRASGHGCAAALRCLIQHSCSLMSHSVDAARVLQPGDARASGYSILRRGRPMRSSSGHREDNTTRAAVQWTYSDNRDDVQPRRPSTCLPLRLCPSSTCTHRVETQGRDALRRVHCARHTCTYSSAYLLRPRAKSSTSS